MHLTTIKKGNDFNMKKIVFTIAIILLMVAMAGTVLGITGTVNTNDLNLRDGASLSSNIITKLNKNETLNIIAEEGDWYKVSYKDYTGYVSKEYLDKNEETLQNPEENNTPIEKGSNKILSNANVYILPLLNSTKIGTLEQGKSVTIISEVGNWKYVQTDDIIGWILESKIEESSNGVNNSNNNENENQVINENNNIQENITENNDVEENNTENQLVENNVNENNSNINENSNNGNDNNNSGENVNSYPTTLYVNVDAVNIREEATTNSDVAASVGLNTPVRVTGESGDWYKVEVSDGKGYIMKQYLSKTKS